MKFVDDDNDDVSKCLLGMLRHITVTYILHSQLGLDAYAFSLPYYAPYMPSFKQCEIHTDQQHYCSCLDTLETAGVMYKLSYA